MKLTPQQKQLALEIATALDDLHSINQHEKFIIQYTEDYLRYRLNYVLSKPRDYFTTNRAAYYVNLVIRQPNFKYNEARS